MPVAAQCAATPILSGLTVNYMAVSHLVGRLPLKASSDVLWDAR
jgi:hypothetical protein